jgi:hypothetical protein
LFEVSEILNMIKYILVIILFLNSGCAAFYGVKEIDYSKYDIQVNEFINQYSNIDLFNCRLDSNFYFKIRQLNYSRQVIKDLNQPLQVFYFYGDSLISYHVNCNAGGFPNLRWNKNGDFNFFPPINQKDVLDFTKEDRLNIANNIKCQSASVMKNGKDVTYRIYVFYTLTIKRQSKLLINQVLSNLKMCNEDYELYLINID